MPEGDTIHRAAAALQRALAGRVITRFESVLPSLMRVALDAGVEGRTLTRVEARGKHLLMHVSGELCLRTHMRMSGSWHIYRSGERWQRPRSQMRIALEVEGFQAVAFLVHEAEWLTPNAMARSALASLGPDVLGEDFEPARAAERILAQAGRPLCDVLLDQRVIAGLGNVYKSELLFLARVHPLLPAGALSAAQAERLTRDAARLLRFNVEPRAAVSGNRRTTHATLNAGEPLWVYGRARQPCRVCGAPIAYGRLGLYARTTYFCPRCQPQPAAAERR